jgi:hypothetical protein
MNAYRFQLFTRDSIGAYTVALGCDQQDARAWVQRHLAPWESLLPLHGPNATPSSFWGR